MDKEGKLLCRELLQEYASRCLEETYTSLGVNLFYLPGGNPGGNPEGGRNLWLSKREIDKLDNLFEDVRQIIKAVEKGNVFFSENKFSVSNY